MDESFDTSSAAVESDTGAAESGQETGQTEGQGTQETQTAQETQQPSPEDIERQREERAFQRYASWQGRREKELLDNIGNIIEQRVRSIQPPPVQPPTPSTTDPAELLENPDGWLEKKLAASFPRVLDQVVQQRTQAENSYNTELIRQAGQLMDSDPLFSDKALGNEVIEEIKKGFGSVNRNVPPALAAQMLVNNSIAGVYRSRSATKSNPLAGNAPGKVVGSVTPPVRTAPKEAPVKLDSMAKKIAAMFGNSDEDVQKMLK